jgi:hypothetical protein
MALSSGAGSPQTLLLLKVDAVPLRRRVVSD